MLRFTCQLIYIRCPSTDCALAAQASSNSSTNSSSEEEQPVDPDKIVHIHRAKVSGNSTFYVGDTLVPPDMLGSVDLVCTTGSAGVGVGGPGAGRIGKAFKWDRKLTEAELREVWLRSKDPTKTTDLSLEAGYDKLNLWSRGSNGAAGGVTVFNGVLQFGDNWRLGIVNNTNGTALSLSHKENVTTMVWTSRGEVLTPEGVCEEEAPGANATKCHADFNKNYTTWDQTTDGNSRKGIKMGYKESSENITVYNDTDAEVICYAEHEHGYLKTYGIFLFFIGIICLLLALVFFMSIACSKDHGREKHITEEEQSSTEIEEKSEVDPETGQLNTTKSRHRTHHHSTADKWYYEELHDTNECRIWLNSLVLIGLVLVAIGIAGVLVWYFLNEHAWNDGSGEEYVWLKWLGLILLLIGLVLWIVLVVLICIAKDDHAVFMWNDWARQGGSTAEYNAEIDDGDSSYHKHTRSRTGGKQVPVRTVRNWIWLLISLVLLTVVCGAVCSTAWYTGYQPHAISCPGSSGNQTETVQEALMIPNPDGCEHEHQYGWMKWLGSGLLGVGVLCLLLALLLFFYVCLIQSHGPCEVTNKGKETHTKESHTKEADRHVESSYSSQSSHSRHSGNWCYGDLADDRDLSNLLLVLVCAGLFFCVCGFGCVIGWYFFNHHEFEGYTETGINETPEAEWMKWLGLALALLALVLLVVVIVLVAIADDDHQVFMWSGWKQVGGHQEEHEVPLVSLSLCQPLSHLLCHRKPITTTTATRSTAPRGVIQEAGRSLTHYTAGVWWWSC